MFLFGQTNQHVFLQVSTGTCISIQSLSKEIHVGVVITAWRRSQLMNQSEFLSKSYAQFLFYVIDQSIIWKPLGTYIAELQLNHILTNFKLNTLFLWLLGVQTSPNSWLHVHVFSKLEREQVTSKM